MSETLSTLEFTNTTSNPEALREVSLEAMETVANEGACAVHDFLPTYHLERAARTLEDADWRTDNNPNGDTVDRRHDLLQYGFAADVPWPIVVPGAGFAPEPVFKAAQQISRFVTAAPSPAEGWVPNEIMGHRYNPGDYIHKHRDYMRAVGYVAVLTLTGAQRFWFERDSGEQASIDMRPGTLTIMRGHQPGSDKPRPLHWVDEAPERRLAISLRQMVGKPW